MTIIGARDHLCIHPEVLAAQKGQKDDLCQRLVKKDGCQFYRGVEAQAELPHFTQINDIEDLKLLGKSHVACPFYVTRRLQTQADIIFLPYNYLINAKIRTSMKIDLAGSVIIFDEAHNLADVCERESSFEFSVASIRQCISELDRWIQKFKDNNPAELLNLEEFKKTLFDFEKALDKFQISAGASKSGDFLFQLFESIQINSDTVVEVLALLGRLEYLQSFEPGQTSSRSGLRLFKEILEVIFRDVTADSKDLDAFRVHVGMEQDRRGYNAPTRQLSFWCLNPGYAMASLLRQSPHSLILTSGTLSPLSTFAGELQLENPHIVPASQVFVGVLQNGPSQKPMLSTFDHRKNTEYMTDLGRALTNLAQIVPAGMLVFFQSYGFMDTCLAHWKQNGTWATMSNTKEQICEPKAGETLKAAMSDFSGRIAAGKGATFYAVLRGKVSEGLDFADAQGRAVIIVGLPYGNKEDPKLKLKREYLDSRKTALSGQVWYTQSATRAVNQAIGRVIRHIKDYGAIILCDRRFGDPAIKKYLSRWLQDQVRTFPRFGEILPELRNFYKHNEMSPSEVPSRASPPPKTSPLREATPPLEQLDLSKPSAFLRKVRQTMARPEYDRFVSALKALKAEPSDEANRALNEIAESVLPPDLHEIFVQSFLPAPLAPNKKANKRDAPEPGAARLKIEYTDAPQVEPATKRTATKPHTVPLITSSSCVVCLKPVRPASAARAPCGHIGDRDCWQDFLRHSSACPACQEPVARSTVHKVYFYTPKQVEFQKPGQQ